MGFPKQEYWSGLPRLPPADLPDPGVKPVSLMSPALAGGFFTTSTTWEAQDMSRLPDPWDSPGKNTGVGCHFHLRVIFLTQELNSCFLCPLSWQVDSLA